jgi:hypothetical protein
MLEAAKFQPEKRTLFRTFDMNAFTRESNRSDHDQYDALRVGEEAAQSSAIPARFPPHRTVDGTVELGAYLASSSYIVSLGGPPLADLKYGIIIVPAGEEDLLFAGYGDHAVMSAKLKEQIYAKSKATQKEQLLELQQKAAHEWINGVASEPEIDDDHREFYRRRWRRRSGLPSDEGSEPAVAATDDRDPAGQNEDDNKTRPIQADVPALSDRQEGFQRFSHGQRSQYVPRHHYDTPSILGDLPMPTNEKQGSEHPAHGKPSPAASTSATTARARSARHLDEHGSEREEVRIRKGASTMSKGSRTANRGGDDLVSPAELNAHIKQNQPRDGGHDSGKRSEQQDWPSASTPTTLQNTTSEGEPLSPEACAAFEVLLGGEEEKRKGPRRVLHSLLARIRLKKSPDPTVKRRDVLRGGSKAVRA